MRDLEYQLKQLCLHNRDGGHGTQANRAKILRLVVIGYRLIGIRTWNTKYPEVLIKCWLSDELSSGTMMNCMNHLRWYD
ncbi:hypothetical protein HBA55_02750 [Pseudomaricurvus alkylphenolicus]|uniref:phage integrase N-terminal domain-containing protein n=1 Tax=Pseudomaricurvus alkylphenolicus TaxID=1306991 RepID=UPI00141ED071|nr:hypothetical protein [Pseudomaricurvus alkylphenolicus]